MYEGVTRAENLEHYVILNAQPQAQSVAVGASATLSVTATGGGSSLTYQWRKDGVNVSGANASSYTLPSAQVSNAGSYTVVVSNTAGSVTSSAATLTVNPVSAEFAPASLDQRLVDFMDGFFDPAYVAANLFLSGANFTEYYLSVWANGGFLTVDQDSGVFTYQKTATNVGRLEYVTADGYFTNKTWKNTYTLTFTNVAGGNYSLVEQDQADLTNTFTYTGGFRLRTRGALPAFTTQPQDRTVAQAPGTNLFSFTLGTSGAGSQYFGLRYHDDGVIDGGPADGGYYLGTNGTVAVPVKTSTVGSRQFDFLVANEFGAVTSRVVTVTIALPPSITSQPQGQTVNPGQSAAFSVTVTGTAPFSYQWRKDGVNVSGANASSYTLPSAQVSNAGSYTVVVSNTAGGVTSSAATLTVNTLSAPVISSATTATATVGQAFSYQITANNSPTGYNATGLPSGVTANTTSGLLSGTPTAAGTSSITLSASNAGGTGTRTLTLTVNPPSATPPSITSQPQAQTVAVGSSATFSVTATGTGPLAYQWRKDGVALGGAMSSSYSITGAQASHAGSYTVVVSNTAGSVTSSAATLTVNDPVVITSQPFQNGSFELNAGHDSSTATGWTITGGPGPCRYRNTDGATDGLFAAMFNNASGSVGAVLSQTFATIPNQLYTVTFDWGNHGIFVSTARLQIEVRDATSGSHLINPAGAAVTGGSGSVDQNTNIVIVRDSTATAGPTQFSSFRFTFTAQSTSSVVSFTDSPSTGDLARTDGILDNVRVAGVVDLASGLVAYYPFNGNANDASGLGNNATLSNAGLTADRFGVPNSAMLISASPTNPGGAYSTQNISIVGNADRSVVFWCKFSAQGSSSSYTQTRVEWGDTSHAGAMFSLSEQSTPDGFVWFWGHYADINHVLAAPPAYNQWRQVTFVYHSSLSEAKCYVNGILQPATGGNFLNQVSSLSTVATSLRMSGGAGDYLDDVRIYNRALSVADVAVLYATEAPPAITAQPQSQVVSAGSAVTFSVTATGSVSFTYQWRKDGVALSGATSSSHTITGAQASHVGSYTVVVSNTAGSVTSSAADLILSGLIMLPTVVVDGIAGRSYRLEFKNTVTDTGWTPLVTTNLPAARLFYTDISATNQPKRFYRVVPTP